MRNRPSQSSEKGNVLLEFALCGTLLVTFFAVIFQLGYACYQYSQLTSAIRGGARFASMQKISNWGDGTLSATYLNEVRNVVVYGTRTTTSASTPILPSLKTSDIDVIVGWDSKLNPKTVEVRVKSFSINALFKTFTIQQKPALTMPFLGLYSPVGT